MKLSLKSGYCYSAFVLLSPAGVYISRASYVREGERSLDSYYRAFHLVYYYRYMRFFSDGKWALRKLLDVSIYRYSECEHVLKIQVQIYWRGRTGRKSSFLFFDRSQHFSLMVRPHFAKKISKLYNFINLKLTITRTHLIVCFIMPACIA